MSPWGDFDSLEKLLMADDDSEDFKWNDTESVVVRQQDAIAVYPNPAGDLVIRRRQAWNEDEDVWIVISAAQVRNVIGAMERVLKEIENAHP
jgi:hypothetical protein